MNNFSLYEIQSLMAAEIMRPFDRGVPSDSNNLMKANDKLSGAARLQIYHDQYWLRLLESIEEDFPGLTAILGRQAFKQLCIAYLTDYPSSSYTLNDLGKNFADFILQSNSLVESLKELAYDMACFEWAEMLAHGAEAKAPITSESLQASPDQLFLRLQPHLSVLQLNYVLDNFLLSLNKQFEKSVNSNAFTATTKNIDKVRLPRRQRTYLAVHRLNNKVFYKRLNAEQYLLLKTIGKGKSLAEACQELIEQEKDPTKLINLPNKLRRYFTSWMELGWFC